MARVSRGRIAGAGIALVVVGLAAAAAALAVEQRACRVAPTAAPAGIRTVLLVTIDTLRADRVGVYGWAAARTPALDELAARGVRFEHAFAAAPITLPPSASPGVG